MAYNTKNNGRGSSKITTSEEQNNLRRAAKAKRKPGSKNGGQKRQTASTRLKEFDPETFEVRTNASTLLTTPYKEKVVAAFGKFFTKNSEDAFNLIWFLTFQPEEKHPLMLKVLGLSSEMISDLPMLLKELVAQYRVYVNPCFMQGPHTSNVDDYADPRFMLAPDGMSDELKQAFYALNAESPATALFVHMMCANYLCNNLAEHVSQNLDRLGSDAENRIHGGILDLIKAVYMPNRDDRYALSAYLKPRYKKIHALLKAMADTKAAEEKANIPAPNLPMADLETRCKQAGLILAGAPEPTAQVSTSKQEPKDAHVLVPLQVTKEDNSPKEFSYSNIAYHSELFSSMATATAQLKELDIDPALIIKNLDQVREFLLLATQLADTGFSPCQYPDKETAIAKVLKAEEARKEAEYQLNA